MLPKHNESMLLYIYNYMVSLCLGNIFIINQNIIQHMPHIKRTYAKPRDNIRQRPHAPKLNISAKYYNAKWSRLRDAHLMLHPLCENCLLNGKITSATEVHHKQIILSGKTDADRYALTLDSNNIMSVCKDCHTRMHKYARKNNLTYVDHINLNKEQLE